MYKYIKRFIPNGMLRQFTNVWKKRTPTTSGTTINNKMNRQSPLKLRTWHCCHPSQVALWDPQYRGPRSITSHSIFNPTSSEPKASSSRHTVLEGQSQVVPESLTRGTSLMREPGSPLSLPTASAVLAFLSPPSTAWPSDSCHLSTVQDSDDLTTGQLPREHLGIHIHKCQDSSAIPTTV